MAIKEGIQQISLVLTSQKGAIVPAVAATKDERTLHTAILQEAALNVFPSWPGKFNEYFCHSPLYVPPSHFEELQSLHAALCKALVSIVGRWWSDEDAQFPVKMPINQHEEELLKWIDGPGHDLVPDFSSHQGCWRPDYLIESTLDEAGQPVEHIRICEINARFPYNGFMVSSHALEAYAKLGTNENFKFLVDRDEVLNALIGMFDTSLPIHFVKDKWPGYDVHLLAARIREKTGQSVLYTEPAKLRLLPSSDSPTGHLLYRVVDDEEEISQSKNIVFENNEKLERVYQVILELMQPELEQLSPDMLRQLATCCVNDLRSALLVHDKRMLGVVLSDLDNLVNKYKVLTPEEAIILTQGITPTILPRTDALKTLVSQCEANVALKDAYVLKAVRGGMAQGHIFGTDVTNDEWLEKLRGIRDADLSLDQNSLTVQKLIVQMEYDIVRRGGEDLEKFFLIASYLSINGRYFGSGPWRLGRQVQVRMNEEQHGIVTFALTRRE